MPSSGVQTCALRSEEHTSELQSLTNLVCRLLLEQKRIASMVGDSARMGINYLISTAAMLSITLAVINIVPFPALDGGRAVFIIVEKIIRRPVPIKYEQLAHTAGFVLLMVLVVVVTVKDVLNIFK